MRDLPLFASREAIEKLGKHRRVLRAIADADEKGLTTLDVFVGAIDSHVKVDRSEWILYEPAVPKCATCNRFSVTRYDNKAKGWCKQPRAGMPMHKPQDGSGYCDEHSELRK